MTQILVIKLGGSVLRDAPSIKKAAAMIREVVQKGYSPTIVVSALKGITDSLIDTVKKANPNASPQEMDEVLSMGERTSARIFSVALSAEGLKSSIIDPAADSWPIITDDNFTDANPLIDEIQKRVQDKILPLIHDGFIPVVCGFVGRTKSGKVTTLGRGGSDTTAVILGSALAAKEVILIKDVDTVFSSDPHIVERPVPIGNLDSEEAFALSLGGAKFLHAKALQYKVQGVRIRIASLENDPFGGTVIDGGSLDWRIESSSNPVSMITIIGVKLNDAKVFGKIIDVVRANGAELTSLGLDQKSLLLYVNGGKDLVNKLHSAIVGEGMAKAISSFDNLSMLSVKGSSMETSPGMIQRITQPLARAGINVYGLATISSSINVFIKKEQADKAVSLVRDSLMLSREGK
jgi:aspartate kinase